MSSRAIAALWTDIRQLVEAGPLVAIRERLRGLDDRDDQIVDRAQQLKARIDTHEIAIAGKAPAVHAHARADVTGLPAILASLDSRISANETAIAQIKQRLGLP